MAARDRIAVRKMGLLAVSLGLLTGCVFVDHGEAALIRNACEVDITVEVIVGNHQQPSDLMGLQELAVDSPGLYQGPVDISVGDVVDVGQFVNFDRRPDSSWTVAVAGRAELLHLSHEEIEAISLSDGGFEWTLRGDDCA